MAKTRPSQDQSLLKTLAPPPTLWHLPPASPPGSIPWAPVSCRDQLPAGEPCCVPTPSTCPISCPWHPPPLLPGVLRVPVLLGPHPELSPVGMLQQAGVSQVLAPLRGGKCDCKRQINVDLPCPAAAPCSSLGFGATLGVASPHQLCWCTRRNTQPVKCRLRCGKKKINYNAQRAARRSVCHQEITSRLPVVAGRTISPGAAAAAARRAHKAKLLAARQRGERGGEAAVKGSFCLQASSSRARARRAAWFH